MASRLKLARAAAAVAGASVALMMTAVIPAGAEPASGRVDSGGDEYGYHVNLGKDYDDMSTGLIGFELADGTKLQMYCVEIDTGIDRKHGMVEQPWDSYPNPKSPFNDNRTQINWILHNAYPVVDAGALTKVLADQGYQATDGINAEEAITATQAAIWHFSDGKNLDENKPFKEGKGPRDAQADVVALYKYLTGDANVGIGDQPTPALAISPTDLSGAAGSRIGPFTVTTTGEIDKLTTKLPDGVKITDANGTDLQLDLAGREAIPDAGDLTERGAFGNLPCGEGFISPAGGNGTLVIDGSMAGIGLVDEPVELVVEGGHLTSARGGQGMAFMELLTAHGDDGTTIAELGVGTNEKAKLTGEVLEDEKILGTCHIAFGASAGIGGTVQVPVHLDCVVMKPTLELDGEAIVRDGELLIP